MISLLILSNTPVAFFTKEVNPRLVKHPLKTNGRLANLELTSLVKEATRCNIFCILKTQLKIFAKSVRNQILLIDKRNCIE